MKTNILVLGVSCFDGMASSMRVRNLLEPLITRDKIKLANLIYEKDSKTKLSSDGKIKEITSIKLTINGVVFSNTLEVKFLNLPKRFGNFVYVLLSSTMSSTIL